MTMLQGVNARTRARVGQGGQWFDVSVSRPSGLGVSISRPSGLGAGLGARQAGWFSGLPFVPLACLPRIHTLRSRSLHLASRSSCTYLGGTSRAVPCLLSDSFSEGDVQFLLSDDAVAAAGVDTSDADGGVPFCPHFLPSRKHELNHI